MSVESINGANHNAVILGAGAGAGALVGAGLGATYGVMSKPYLDGVLPTDVFMTKTLDNLTKSSDKETKDVATFVKSAVETLKNAKTGTDLAPIANKPIDKLFEFLSTEKLKETAQKGKEILEFAGDSIPKEVSDIFEDLAANGDVIKTLKNTVEKMGDNVPEGLKEIVSNINSKEDLAGFMKFIVGQKFADVSVPELKASFEAVAKLVGTNLIALAQLSKPEGTELKASEAALVDAVTSAAHSITKSAALKFGAIGAAAVGAAGGAVAWLLHGKTPEETIAPADTQTPDEKSSTLA